MKSICIFSYYNLDDTDHGSINVYLSSLVDKALFELESSYCIEIGEVHSLFTFNYIINISNTIFCINAPIT